MIIGRLFILFIFLSIFFENSFFIVEMLSKIVGFVFLIMFMSDVFLGMLFWLCVKFFSGFCSGSFNARSAVISSLASMM